MTTSTRAQDSSAPKARVPGSVRFDAYYKVQIYRERDAKGKPLRAWVDIKQRYATEAEARRAAPAGARINIVTERGHETLEEPPPAP